MYALCLQGHAELCLVAEDYTATGDGELSVQRGQQVELLDSCAGGSSELCLVRLVNADLTINPVNQGLVPMATIKQVQNLKVSSSRTSIENEGLYSNMLIPLLDLTKSNQSLR